MRLYAGMTQAALAQKAEVSLRSVQMYEQRRKDINKAQAETLFRLAAVLGCREKDLLECK
jgi:transcriptional regulator with XRE-family HTH domain